MIRSNYNNSTLTSITPRPPPPPAPPQPSVPRQPMACCHLSTSTSTTTTTTITTGAAVAGGWFTRTRWRPPLWRRRWSRRRRSVAGPESTGRLNRPWPPRKRRRIRILRGRESSESSISSSSSYWVLAVPALRTPGLRGSLSLVVLVGVNYNSFALFFVVTR